MAIKYELNLGKPLVPARTYPYLAKDPSDGQVVIFFEKNHCVTLGAGSSVFNLGEELPDANENMFDPLPIGTSLTLKVE